MPTRTDLLNPEYYLPILFNLVRIGFILVFAYIATLVLGRVVRGIRKYTVKMMLRGGGGSANELEKRAATIGGLIRKTVFTLIWTIAWLMILKEMNFDVRPLLAGAGIAGVAVGFGAQSIIKDVLSGLFLMLENQIRVNDIAIINGTGGLVEEINLRTTVLRGEDGSVYIFPNGNIQSLSNLTREYSYYLFNISVSYSNDTDHVVDVLKQLGEELMRGEPYKSAILAPLEIIGVDQLANFGVVIKARFKTLPAQQWTVGREMNRRIKKRFEETDIQIPFPAQIVRVLPQVPQELRNELKGIVREVLDERSPAVPTKDQVPTSKE